MDEMKIYGASDDLIEIEGSLREEFSHMEENPAVLSFSDGTLLEVRYDGIWRISTLHKGSCEIEHDPNSISDDERYSDIVTLRGQIEWVAKGIEYKAVKS